MCTDLHSSQTVVSDVYSISFEGSCQVHRALVQRLSANLFGSAPYSKTELSNKQKKIERQQHRDFDRHIRRIKMDKNFN